VAEDLHIVFHAVEETYEGLIPVRNLRLGVYQRFWGGNIDEGWTRWLLEHFEFPYKTIHDSDVRAHDLKERFDVLILPNDQTPFITGTGFIKWMPITRLGFLVLAAISPMGSDDVLVARMVSRGHISSNALNASCFILKSSAIDSITIEA
jgi:hypothetical protein